MFYDSQKNTTTHLDGDLTSHMLSYLTYYMWNIQNCTKVARTNGRTPHYTSADFLKITNNQ